MSQIDTASLVIPYAFGEDDISVVRAYTRNGTEVRLCGDIPGRTAHYEGTVSPDGAVSLWIVTPGSERVIELTDEVREHLRGVHAAGVTAMREAAARRAIQQRAEAAEAAYVVADRAHRSGHVDPERRAALESAWREALAERTAARAAVPA